MYTDYRVNMFEESRIVFAVYYELQYYITKMVLIISRPIHQYTVSKKFTPKTFMITMWNENRFK